VEGIGLQLGRSAVPHCRAALGPALSRRLEVHDMVEVLRGDPHEVVIRVSGSLDDGEGGEVAECVGGLAPTDRLVVDFSQPQQLRDADLGAIARHLVKLASVRVRGLGRHHVRLLRYCGVRVAPVISGGAREG
jgi:hypothetical protein